MTTKSGIALDKADVMLDAAEKLRATLRARVEQEHPAVDDLVCAVQLMDDAQQPDGSAGKTPRKWQKHSKQARKKVPVQASLQELLHDEKDRLASALGCELFRASLANAKSFVVNTC